MKLFISPTSPYARLCRAVIIEKGLTDQVELDKTDPWQSDPALVEANTFSKIPSLVLDDGEVLTESLLISQYLDGQAGGKSLVDDADRTKVFKKLGVAFGFIDAAVAIASAGKFKNDLSDDAIITRRHAAIERSLPLLDQLPVGDPSTPDLGDLALAVALGYLDFRFKEFDWRANAPQISQWYKEIASRPALNETMPG
ncbi:glutathione S-transferase family protein [Salinisphaera sp. T31B1]|uniref:glutathione S-transferase family protein n=1 Tax=Salinisphaera sp. T31B1 TaxID=727963 RepID=UPI003340C11B